MKPSKSVMIVSLLAGLFAVVQSAAGLFWQGGSGPFSFTTLHGEVVQMYGQGLYQYDTYFRAPIFRGTDAATLFLGVPLLLVSLYFYSRGSLRGQLLLTGVLSYLLYNSSSVAMGTAYNNMFLEYIFYFSTSLFAFVLAVSTVDLRDLAARVSSKAPRKGIAGLMFFSTAGLLFAWLTDILNALAVNGVPAIDSYTTEVTHVIDLGIIVPTAFLTGLLILRRAPISYLLSAVMMILLVIIGAVVTTQTVFQSMAGIQLSTGEFIGKAGSFILLSLFAVWLLIGLFRSISETTQTKAARMQGKAVKA